MACCQKTITKTKYTLNNDFDRLIQYLLSKSHRLNPRYLNQIDPLLIINLDDYSSPWQTLIIDHHNQIWHSDQNFRQLTNQWFDRLAYSYPRWCDLMATILGNRQRDLPYVYGNHIFIKVYLEPTCSYHWLNLSLCHSIHNEKSYNQSRYIFTYLLESLAQHFEIVIENGNHQLKEQLSLAYRLNYTYHQALHLFLRQFHSMVDYSTGLYTHPCFAGLDQSLRTSPDLAIQASDLRPALLPK